MIFSKRSSPNLFASTDRPDGFGYLGADDIYLDSACQSLRPQPVMDALQQYYQTYNACAGRVKYAWGQRVDEAIARSRRHVLMYLGLSDKHYATAFTLNTTYGLNLLLQQLPSGRYGRIVTSDIEHNSVFLPTMTAAQRLGIPRLVLPRLADGGLDYEPAQLEGAIVVVNVVSNIDGRQLTNLHQLVRDVHDRGGIIIADAAQAVAHHADLLRGVSLDAICFSAHKLYSASLGVVVARHELLASLTPTFVGGGMVTAVRANDYDLYADDPVARLEPGLQAFGEIIALDAALDWLETLKPGGQTRADYLAARSQELYDGLKTVRSLELLNSHAGPVISAYSSAQDAHRLAVFLSAANVMVRSGYFCCHYYLQEVRQLPPLLRFSVGLHTTSADIQTTITTLHKLLGKDS